VKFDEENDLCIWTPNLNENFTLASAWRTIRHGAPVSSKYGRWWDKHIPIKLSIHMWRLTNNILSVDAAVQEKGIITASKCVCCVQKGSIETIEHLFGESEL
ncbi:zinc-binding domain-containing protein, partial [Shigella flexneri]|nr:zinc-binding domain-containing protein [Shigella flexneri]